MHAAIPFDLVRRRPSPQVAGLVSRISFYRERGRGTVSYRHAAPLTFPLVISLGTPFRIGLGRVPGHDDGQPSFTAGLFPGPVLIESDGGAECVQVDFTLLGAYRFFGGAVTELTARMIDIEDVLGREGHSLRQRVGESDRWSDRFAIVEDFILRRAGHRPSPEIAAALAALESSGGAARIRDIAAGTGWSRKHFGRRFLGEIGLPPKTLARMLRFHRASKLARGGEAGGWADVAAEAGYADQAHLTRDFRVFSGETPGEWARRLALSDRRLLREAGG